MGLETGHEPARGEVASRLKGGGDLGRMVGVVVEHARAGGRRAVVLEPPPRAAEAVQRRGGLRRLHPGGTARGEGRERVEDVVLAGNGQLDLGPVYEESRAQGQKLELLRVVDAEADCVQGA